MSRIGKLPIAIPSGVTITIDPDTITVAGPKGTLSQFTMEGVTVTNEDGNIIVTRINDEPKNRAKHGLMRALLNNMVEGVTNGFSKKLEINGVGYRVAPAGAGLKLNLGFSHDVNFALPTGISAAVEQNTITVTGIDKQQVGQVAAEIRALKKPEPYKGKGIKYSDERIIRKSGKSGKDK
ncbi:MAG: ribosomal protein [Candidatus Saccharibacteria bacterium]|nr:ribosomal protein [Candidatus Saccharibacteria bacterium]